MNEPVWTYEADAAFDHCRYLLGDGLLSFLANTPAADPDDRRTKRTVRRIAATLDLLEREDRRLPVALVRMRDARQLPWAWALRQANGGDVPDPYGTDALERVLTRLARDVYPALLGPSDRTILEGPGLNYPVADSTASLDELIDMNADAQEVERLLEPLAASTFGAAGESAARPFAHVASPGGILSAAAKRIRHVESPDAVRFMAISLEVIGELQALATRETVRVPAFVGFTTLPLEAEASVVIPQGNLRVATPSERRIAPFALQADSVLVTTVESKLVEPHGEPPQLRTDAPAVLNDCARELILAAALGGNRRVPASLPSVAWITTHGFGVGPSTYRPLMPDRAPGRFDPLSDEELSGLRRWAEHVAAADLKRVEIAVERILRAIWEVDWAESLIDAVIAWENLFGTRQETAYRVTAALAVLCEPRAQSRFAVQKRLTAVYNARSRLVHGDPAPEPLHEHRMVAIQTALEALRRLILDRGDLLMLAKSSKRADHLLLGVQPIREPERESR